MINKTLFGVVSPRPGCARHTTCATPQMTTPYIYIPLLTVDDKIFCPRVLDFFVLLRGEMRFGVKLRVVSMKVLKGIWMFCGYLNLAKVEIKNSFIK